MMCVFVGACYEDNKYNVLTHDELAKKICEVRIALNKSQDQPRGSEWEGGPDPYLVPFSQSPQDSGTYPLHGLKQEENPKERQNSASSSVATELQEERSYKQRKKKRVSFTAGNDGKPQGSHTPHSGETSFSDLQNLVIPDAYKECTPDWLRKPCELISDGAQEEGVENTQEEDDSRLIRIVPEQVDDTVVSSAITSMGRPNPVLIVPRKEKSTPNDPYATTFSKGKTINICLCSLCNREFGSKIMLEIHARRCNLTSPTSPKMKTLLSKSSTNRKTYNPEHDPYHLKSVCNLCNKQFASKQWLIIHQKSDHGIIRKYRCEFCLRSYSTNQQLQTHIFGHHTSKN